MCVCVCVCLCVLSWVSVYNRYRRCFSRFQFISTKHDLCIAVAALQSPSAAEPVKSVDDFVPDDALDASFLDDSKDVKESKPQPNPEDESDRLKEYARIF